MMKNFLILAPLVLCGGFFIFHLEKGESKFPGDTKKGNDEELTYRIENEVHSDTESSELAPSEELEGDDSTENDMFTEFTGSGQSISQEFDFPEREFPDAPAYYSSANGPE